MNGFDAISKCPRPHCNGTIVPFTGYMETDRKNMWKCMMCNRVFGDVTPPAFTDEDVAADRTAGRRIQNSRRYY